MAHTSGAFGSTFAFHADGTFSDSGYKAVGTGTPWGNSYSKSGASGTYTVNGYTIELKYGNGKTIKRAFWRFSDGSIFLNGTLYTPPT